MSSSPYVPIYNTISDKEVTKPLPIVSIPSKFHPVQIGPRFGGRGNTKNAPYIENFNPPVFQPNNAYYCKHRSNCHINNQGSGWKESEKCPEVPILLRNEWENYNTTNAKSSGGFDMYNVFNVPSCSDRSGNYMNIIDTYNPWGRMIAGDGLHEDRRYFRDSHGGDL